jgi:hypothetical protein
LVINFSAVHLGEIHSGSDYPWFFPSRFGVFTFVCYTSDLGFKSQLVEDFGGAGQERYNSPIQLIDSPVSDLLIATDPNTFLHLKPNIKSNKFGKF